MCGDNFYDRLSAYYDIMQDEMDPSHLSGICLDLIAKHLSAPGDGSGGRKLLCDLGCGNGRVTSLFAKKDFDLIGVDSSPEMLNTARENDPEILWICQDITKLDLFGSCDIFLCLLDTINHLTEKEDLSGLFLSVSKFLNAGGVFIFDAATRKHFEETLADQVFFEDYDDFTLLWENRYDPEERFNEAFLTLFEKEDDGRYIRSDGVITERFYEKEDFVKAAAQAGLAFKEDREDGERIFMVFKKETL